jgi:hypothetical protein
MTKLSRVILSFVSAISSDLIVGLIACFNNSRSTWLSAFVSFLYFSSLLVIPGWFISLPIVLSIKRFDGWRIWLQLAIGSAIGPVVILSLALYSNFTSPQLAAHDTFFYFAAAISFLSTALYLFSARQLSARIESTS